MTFVLFGIAILTVFVWQVIVEKEYSWLDSAHGLPIFFTTIGLGVFMLCFAFQRSGPGRKELEKNRIHFTRALKQPDWVFYEEHLGRPVLFGIAELFADANAERWEVPCFDEDDLTFVIDSLSPVEESFLLKRESTGFDFDLIPFALTDDGDPVFLKPGAEEADTVYIAVGCEYEKFSDSTANWTVV